jgi:hypothetical protein
MVIAGFQEIGPSLVDRESWKIKRDENQAA